ncbi:acyl-CoA desaturase [Aeromicrobium sp. SMF47]|uniref:fatty acid desaturase family protein n=1 Tax=Aeromicrobium TaxID=2040 RepID=UPI00129E36FD|nr:MULTISPECIES: fatty acid desaturase [Aeromicrobium]MRJ77909.1 acyl-CoA desaturase [Aeromicrobium yanjiei]MRK02269.1 acyl-CoA desaturase [Aeromicrobium sp. S22]
MAALTTAIARKFTKNAPIKPRSASNHNTAPLTLINPTSERPATIGLDYMTYEQLEEFGRELDAVRQRVLDDLGQKDADYIRRVIRIQRGAEVVGRIGIFMPFFPPAFIAGIGSLAVAKILDNMEIGHNVMHGQYDWMNDPMIDGARYEWDNIAPAQDWKHGHNYIHHTYTNIHGMDRDIGYNMFRIDEDQPWYPSHRFNLPLATALMMVFEWGIMYHGVELDQYLHGKISKEDFEGRKKRAFKKIRKQVFKDYIAWPALGLALVPFMGWWAPVAILGANVAANVIRNVWTFLIIFCGHFPAEVETFKEEDAQNENRGQWYLRQLLGSANITGRKPFHVMTGNLSYQIEHHLFPDIPARRYPEVAEDVNRLVEKYGLHYNTGRLSKQLGSVIRQLAKLGKKPSDPYKIGNSPESKALRRAKREEAARRLETAGASHLAS